MPRPVLLCGRCGWRTDVRRNLLWLVPAALLVGWETLFDATRFAQRLRVSVWLKGPG